MALHFCLHEDCAFHLEYFLFYSLALREASCLIRSCPMEVATWQEPEWGLLTTSEEQRCSVQYSITLVKSLSHVWLCDPMDCSTPGLPVHHQLLELAQTHVHRVGDAIQPSHPLLSPSPPALNLSQHQGLFKWVSSLHQVAKVLEFQLQHESFQWTLRTDLL